MLPHMDAAYNLARWLTRQEQDARDVVQESYLRAFKFFDGYQGGDAKSWLLSIVRNTCFTWLQKEKRAAPVPFEETIHGGHSDAANAERKMIDAEKTGVLHGCIDALPAEYREVILMRELEELSYKQIAEIANVPVGTVMSRLSRARQRLEDCVKGSAQGNRA